MTDREGDIGEGESGEGVGGQVWNLMLTKCSERLMIGTARTKR